MNSAYLTRKDASAKLGIHFNTLYKLSENNEIETIKIGEQKRYNIDKYLKSKDIKNISQIRRRICYCRVSSSKQKEDLNRQIKTMTDKYPTYELITDIGSSLNLNREGLKRIIDYAIKGEIEILVVAFKDRLARFGFDLIERLINEYSEGIIKIEDKTEEKTPLDEMTKDIISIMNIYVAKMNGLRKYKKMLVDDINQKN